MTADPHGWLPVLLDGFVGSVVAALVAFMVVRLQRRSDIDGARLLAAFDAAEHFGISIADATIAAMALANDTYLGGTERETVLMTFLRDGVRYEPTLTPFLSLDACNAFRDALKSWERELRGEPYRIDDQGKVEGNAQSMQRAKAATALLASTGEQASEELAAFRRAGSPARRRLKDRLPWRREARVPPD